MTGSNLPDPDMFAMHSKLLVCGFTVDRSHESQAESFILSK